MEIIEKNEELFYEYKSYEQYLKEQLQNKSKNSIKASMFPDTPERMKEYQIENTMRVLPHDQDTGGFFLALIRKKGPIYLKKKEKENLGGEKKVEDNKLIEEILEKEKIIEKGESIEKEVSIEKEDSIEKEEEIIEKEITEKEEVTEKNVEEKNNKKEMVLEKQDLKGNKTKKKVKKEKEIQWIDFDYKEWEWIKDFYGFEDDRIYNRLVWQKKGDKKVMIVSEKIKAISKSEKKEDLNQINMGCKAFSKNREEYAKETPYRICQDSILEFLPLITKRKILLDIKDFSYFLDKNYVKYDDFENKELAVRMKEMGLGSVVLYIEIKKGESIINDALICQNFKNTISVMCPKEFLEGFKIRYLS